MASLSCELHELVSLRPLREGNSPQLSHCAHAEFLSGQPKQSCQTLPPRVVGANASNTALLSRSKVSANRTFPPSRVEWSQPIGDFPTREPGMFAHHSLKSL